MMTEKGFVTFAPHDDRSNVLKINRFFFQIADA